MRRFGFDVLSSQWLGILVELANVLEEVLVGVFCGGEDAPASHAMLMRPVSPLLGGASTNRSVGSGFAITCLAKRAGGVREGGC